MKKVFAILMALTVLLTLTACGNKAQETVPPAPEQQETPAEPMPELTKVPELQIPAEETEGRIPGGEYVLPDEISTMEEWYRNGAVALLARKGDVAFYGLEGKESNPALLCWGDAQAEFDWIYSTPRAFEPELQVYDIDGDGEDEAVVNCYGGSGTGVSLEFIHVVEKSADDTLTAYALPWEALTETLNAQLQTVSADGNTYAALGRELVDITADLKDADADSVEVRLGEVATYRTTETGLTCTVGVVAEGGNIPPLACYVAEAEGEIRYENGVFTLENLHLSSI